MFEYYFRLALRSFRRSPVLTALMVLTISLGIGASMTMLTVLHVMTADPLPGRSAHLFRPYLNASPLEDKSGDSAPNPNLPFTWPDAQALLHAHKAVRQAAMARGSLTAYSDQSGVHPKSVTGSFTTRDFFAMFGVPFVAGSAWSQQADTNRAMDVVLTQKLAQRLLGIADASALGKVVRLGKHDFTVVGLTRAWHPVPFFYGSPGAPRFNEADQFFLPLSTAVSLKLDVNFSNGWGGSDSVYSLTSPDVAWLQVWVQLDTPAQVGAYRRFLFNYAAQQHALGRIRRPPDEARLYGLMPWLFHEGLVPSDVSLQAWLAVGFLIVCMVNIVALLLTKFLRRSGEISVRRALGARRRDIFQQFGMESALVGLVGGLLGIGIAELGLWAVRHRPDGYAHLAHMDVQMLGATVVLAIIVSLLAGLLPAWLACRVAPAVKLKTL